MQPEFSEKDRIASAMRKDGQKSGKPSRQVQCWTSDETRFTSTGKVAGAAAKEIHLQFMKFMYVASQSEPGVL